MQQRHRQGCEHGGGLSEHQRWLLRRSLPFGSVWRQEADERWVSACWARLQPRGQTKEEEE